MKIDTATHRRFGKHPPIPPSAVHSLAERGLAYSEDIAKTEASVADLLLRAASVHPDSGIRLFVGDRDEEGTFRSYAALLEEAQRILGGLQTCGHFPGDNVVLFLDRAVDLVPALWACLLGGYVPCPVVQIRDEHESWAKQVARLDALLEHPLFVTRGALRNKLRGIHLADLDSLRASEPERKVLAGSPTDPALIALTSGTNDGSKAVVLTHENLLGSMMGKAERQKLTSADVILNWLPLDHVAALLDAHLLPLYVGATQLQVEREIVLAQPLRFLRLIDKHRVTMAFAPDFVLGKIKAVLQSAKPGPARRQILKCNLFSLRHLISRAEPNVIEGSRLFLDFLTQFGLARTAVWRAFCMTETCGGSVYSCEFPVRDPGRERATLGVPIDGLEMRIVDAAEDLLPGGEPGELQLRGPMIFTHYYNDEAATTAAFTKDGWLRTGTVGRLEEGRLKLLGRTEDSVTIEGAQHFSHELETALEKLGGIERSFVAAFPTHRRGSDTEQLAVLFAPSFAWKDESRLYQLTAAVRNTVALLWGVKSSLILPLPKDLFPKTILGKIDRALLRKSLEDGDLVPYEDRIAEVTCRQMGSHTLPGNPQEVAIAAIYAELLGCSATCISSTASFFDCGGTSLDVLKLKRKLEQRFGIKEISIATVLHNSTVRELATCVAAGRDSQKSDYDPIVPLQLCGNKTPLFCVHPESGEVLAFVNLAGYFVNERPFFALQARGFNEGERCFSTLDELVSTYISAIRKRQLHGPYAIAGYSYGGVIAFEIAKVLQAQGERVAFVSSFNQPPYLGFREKKLSTPDDAVARSLLKFTRAYEASGTVASMTVFYAHPLQGNKEDWLIDELKQWDGFTRLRNRYIDVSGDHSTFIGPKHVYSFQSVLRAELDRALGGM